MNLIYHLENFTLKTTLLNFNTSFGIHDSYSVYRQSSIYRDNCRPYFSIFLVNSYLNQFYNFDYQIAYSYIHMSIQTVYSLYSYFVNISRNIHVLHTNMKIIVHAWIKLHAERFNRNIVCIECTEYTYSNRLI